MSAELPTMTSSEDPPRCERHDKILDYRCDTHGYHICADCAVFDHRQCVVSSVQMTSQHDSLSCSISPVLIKATHHISDVNSKLGRLLESRDTVALTLANCFDKLRDAIDAAESEQYAQLEFLYNIEETRLLDWKENCQHLVDKAKVGLERARKGETARTPSAMKSEADSLKTGDAGTLSGMKSETDSLKTGETVVSDIEAIRHELEDCLLGNDTNVQFTFSGEHDFEKRVAEFSFLPGKVVVKHESLDHAPPQEGDWIVAESPSILSESESGCFVDIPLDGATDSASSVNNTETTPQDVTPEHIGDRRRSSCDQPVTEHNILEVADAASVSTRGRSTSMLNVGYSLTLKSTINALMPSDKSPSWLTGATFLVNNSIAVADRKNKKVKLFSSALHCIAETVITSYPFDIAQTGDFDLVVTIPRHKRVQFFSSEDLKASPLFIDTEQTCLGVSCSKEFIAVVCETTWTKFITIKLYDNLGSLIRKVSKIDDTRDLAFASEYISICPVSGNMAFRNGINLFYTTSEGDLLWKYIIPNQLMANNVRGVATLNGGILVVFDVSVYYVTSGGRKWKMLSSFSRQSSPTAICVSRSKSCVLITHADPIRNRPENNVVEIFTLSQQFE